MNVETNQTTLKALFIDQIRDIYDAEKQLVKALPKLAKATESQELRQAILSHLEETQNQVSRLEEVFSLAGVAPKGKSCKGMKGLIEEGGDAAKEDEGPLRDLAIIAGAQRVEHYEISAYGTARTLADQLGLREASDRLRQTQDEEQKADSKLTQVASKLYESIDSQADSREGARMASASSHGAMDRETRRNAR